MHQKQFLPAYWGTINWSRLYRLSPSQNNSRHYYLFPPAVITRSGSDVVIWMRGVNYSSLSQRDLYTYHHYSMVLHAVFRQVKWEIALTYCSIMLS